MIEMTLSSRHRIRTSSPVQTSVTEAPHNTNFHTWMGKKQFCFFQTAETGNRTPDSGVKGSGANHYPRAPALLLDHLVTVAECKNGSIILFFYRYIKRDLILLFISLYFIIIICYGRMCQ